MIHSELFKAIPAALVNIQADVKPAQKGVENAFFHSQYADLESVIASVRALMVREGLSLMQFPSVDYERMVDAKAAFNEEDGGKRSRKVYDIKVPRVSMTTRIDHPASGEWIEHTLEMIPMDNSPQAIGSCQTYCRRYSLNPILGLVSADDDGNAASGNASQPAQNKGQQAPAAQSQPRQAAPAQTPPKTPPTAKAPAGGQKKQEPAKNDKVAPYAINEKEQKDRGCINTVLVSELRQAVLVQDKANKLDPTAEFMPWLDSYLDAQCAKPGMEAYKREHKGTAQILLDIPSTVYAKILERVQKEPETCRPGHDEAAAQEAAGDDGVAE